MQCMQFKNIIPLTKDVRFFLNRTYMTDFILIPSSNSSEYLKSRTTVAAAIQSHSTGQYKPDVIVRYVQHFPLSNNP